jgi:hypothetical protein
MTKTAYNILTVIYLVLLTTSSVIVFFTWNNVTEISLIFQTTISFFVICINITIGKGGYKFNWLYAIIWSTIFIGYLALLLHIEKII